MQGKVRWSSQAVSSRLSDFPTGIFGLLQVGHVQVVDVIEAVGE